MLVPKAKNLFFFLSLLFAGAYAQDVYKNNTLLTDNTATIMYGENVTFSIRNAPIGYGWCWASELEPTFCLSSTLSWIPYIDVNADEVKHIKITGKKAGASDISIDLTVTIEHRPSYAVTFDPDGGSPVPAAQSVLKDSLAIKPPNPEKAGHKFNHWYISAGAENAPFSFATRITEDVALKASWTILKYVITWNFDNGSPNQIDSVEYNNMPTKPADPTKISNAYTYDFTGWSPAIAAATKNETYTAQYSATPIDYTITYETNDPSITQPPQTYNITNAITMPVLERCGYKYDYWYENQTFSGQPTTVFTPTESNIGNKTFYLKWTPSLATPSESLLDYAIPVGLIYSGSAISPIDINPEASNKCALGKITTLYNGSEELPKDAGTYTISAKIDKNDNYEAKTIELSQLVIQRKPVDVAPPSYEMEDKEYDATRVAIFKDLRFNNDVFFNGDFLERDVDYSATASYASANAGTDIEINVVIKWKESSALNKNYIISPDSITFKTKADILVAEGILKIRPPQDYMLADKTKKPTVIEKNSFILDSYITWEYKRDGGEWTKELPNRIGDWMVRASFPDDPTNNKNYTGAADSAEFFVIRGDLPVSRDDSKIEADGTALEKEGEFSSRHKEYFVVEPDNCSVKNAKILITLYEPDLILKIDGDPQIPQNGEDCDQAIGEYCETRYNINYDFESLSPGTDKFIYVLTSKYDDIDKFEERDTIIIERPVPFDSVITQKWNNTLVANNNYQKNKYKANGGYNFNPESFKWFIDGKEETACRGSQFCSVDESGAKTLNPSSQYAVQMTYQKEGETFRISTCYGSPKLKVSATPAQSAIEKRVLGINGKTAPQGSKIYNSKGERASGEAPGVYLIENK